MIDYNDRFMISDSLIRPLVYEVSKIEDTFPRGTIKLTLKQDHYNEHLDNVELQICNYYNYPMQPEVPIQLPYKLIYSGTSPIIYMGKSARKIELSGEILFPYKISWKYSFDNKILVTKDELTDFIIEENENYIEIASVVNLNNIGKILKVSCFLTEKVVTELELEVKL